jgi:hypothetical protein
LLWVSLPLTVLVPVQLPLAVQLSAIGALQLSVTLSPGLTPVSLAERVRTGTATASTMTLRMTDPPGPEQLRMNSLRGEVRVPVELVPLLILVPVMGAFHAPLAVQAVAFVLDQRRVVDLLTATLDAAALKVSVGAAGWANEIGLKRLARASATPARATSPTRPSRLTRERFHHPENRLGPKRRPSRNVLGQV